MNPQANPAISIVTPSFNQGQYIRANIESVLQQDFSDYEHLVIDGGSTDQTLSILGEYPHLHVVTGPDNGHADALNKGFGMARGRFFAFLNADDTLMPGALSAVSGYIEAHPDVRVIMGRCRFIDAEGNYTGIEHPSYFSTHRRLLAIWKGHGVPQPSVFFNRQVWETSGPMDVNLPYAWIDYDFFCRASKDYSFETIDSILSNYRLHASSKTTAVDEAQRLDECIEISRSYWGPFWSPSRWQLEMSHWWFRFDRKARGLTLLKRARSEWKHSRHLLGLFLAACGTVLAPDAAFRSVIYPPFRNRVLDRLAARGRARPTEQTRRLDPQTAALLDHKLVWGDGWVGPELEHSLHGLSSASRLEVKGWTDVLSLGGPLKLTFYVAGSKQRTFMIEETGPFRVSLDLKTSASEDPLQMRVLADRYFVPDHTQHSGDMRPLAWKLETIEAEDS